MEGTPDYYHYIGEELGANHNNRSIDPSPTHVLPGSANKPVVSFPLAEGGIMECSRHMPAIRRID